MPPVIESVVNVSEGRDRALIDRLAAGISGVAGVTLLDHSADAAHHRAVFTMAGSRDPLLQAVLGLVNEAVASIDLRRHHGEHPRIGAVDVIPFIPLGGATMAECVELARRAGRAIGEQFGIPVYLYGDAASRPDRVRLEDVRRGQFEGLAARMRLPAWHPDFGPATPHPSAGATAVGARHVLIAFNVVLDSRDLSVARAIAREVREKNGGLAGVKALGLMLHDRGLAQVSMNLTDPRRTDMETAFDRVRTAAREHGVDVLESELIGLAPAAALNADIAGRIRLKDYSPRLILEQRLALS